MSKKQHFEFGNYPNLEKFLTPAASLDTSKLEHHKSHSADGATHGAAAPAQLIQTQGCAANVFLSLAQTRQTVSHFTKINATGLIFLDRVKV